MAKTFWWAALGLAGCATDSAEPSHHDMEVADRAEEDVDDPCEVPEGALACETTREEPVIDVHVWDDLDRDGFAADVDPDDEEPSVFPGARERECDGIDQDQDGIDPCSPDSDGDGIRASDDCDDTDPDIGPLAHDVWCNGRDENCNGIDECDTDGDGTLDHHDPDPEDPAVDGHAHEAGEAPID